MKLSSRIKMIQAWILVVVLALGWQVFNRARSSPYDLLMNAVESGDIRAVKAELDKGTNPNNLPPAQYEPIAPLCAAAAEGKLEIVRLLLDRGAIVQRGDGADATPLEAAATHNQIKVMQLLITRGAPINDFYNGSSYSLWEAAVEGKTEAVKFLLAHGANPNTKALNEDKLIDAVKMFNQGAVAAELKKARAK